MKSIPSDPILTCEESLVFEKEFFGEMKKANGKQ